MNITDNMEFIKIKQMWSELAVTQAAKDKIIGCVPILSEMELRKQQKDTTEGRFMIEQYGTPPVASVDEIPEIMSLAVCGKLLTTDQLERVAGALTAVKRMQDYLRRGRTENISLAYYDENLDSLDDLREEIQRQIRNGQVDSHASANLLRIRSEIITTEEKMKQRAEQVMHTYKDCMADSYSTYRNGRLCVPVKKEWRFKVPGSVIDKSSTGNTLFMEPTAVAKYFEELQNLRIDEENEIYQILYTLTAMVGECTAAMEENVRVIEMLDFVFSKGKLSIDLCCVEPDINTDDAIKLTEARHPLMDRKKCVPLNLTIGGARKGIVITGPNTGGKTVSIKNVALNCVMAQCGLHVCCVKANICMRSSYLCDIGDGQNISENLSTFSAHINNVLSILESANASSFVIMDELGSGTDPTEGMGIAVSILEELRKKGCLFLVTTHYPEVKEYAERTDSIVNARMTFDRETLSPTYRMIVGEAGESCAFYIAEKLGMPKGMLKTAIKAAYGESAIEEYQFINEDNTKECVIQKRGPQITKIKKQTQHKNLSEEYHIGDSVMVYPDKKIGIVCAPINEKGMMRIQMPHGKIEINHKRVKLHVPADKLYPEDYDFSIIFDTVEHRKARHDMERKLTDTVIEYEE
ncbi:MAG: DNA mismatch repair protein MutS [Lachnospiraceae bacterium]|nr:DNA mismatch repair protein MutS [Lachnospiraceae bacterium]